MKRRIVCSAAASGRPVRKVAVGVAVLFGVGGLVATLATLAIAATPMAAVDIIGTMPFGIVFTTVDDTLADHAIDNELG